MNASKRKQLVTLLIISIAVVPAASGNENTNSDKKTLNELNYTKSELQSLYDKYNISENDIKFSKDKLPHYLKGTILNSDKRVIATEDGTPSEGLVKGEDYEIVISHDKMNSIIDQARQDYINKYGVDPANPKVEMVNGQPLPKKEVKRLVESGEIELSSNDDVNSNTNNFENNTLSEYSTTTSDGPRAIDGKINQHIFVASNDRHEPTETITTPTDEALARFEQFGINVYITWYWNYWDASDVSPADDTEAVKDDLDEDHGWEVVEAEAADDLVLGWAHDLDNNGMADLTGRISLCSDSANLKLDWPHDSIVQHEVSHNFDAEDQNHYNHPECIMSYEWANSGTDIWCSSCEDVVQYGIWN